MIQRMMRPSYEEDVIAEWAAEDWDFMDEEDELHSYLSPPRRKVIYGVVVLIGVALYCFTAQFCEQGDSFFSAVVDDSKRAASKLQDQVRWRNTKYSCWITALISRMGDGMCS